MIKLFRVEAGDSRMPIGLISATVMFKKLEDLCSSAQFRSEQKTEAARCGLVNTGRGRQFVART
jgi:hypothetical protein